VRGIVDHGFCRSIYFRDPDGYVIELTADTGKPTEGMEPVAARRALAAWQAAKR
jgi:catechol-2,3-dioxygenase